MNTEMVRRPSLPNASLEGRRVLVECLSRRGLPFHHSRRLNFAVELRIVLTLANRRLRTERITAVKERFECPANGYRKKRN
jgi:hypothetical protein